MQLCSEKHIILLILSIAAALQPLSEQAILDPLS